MDYRSTLASEQRLIVAADYLPIDGKVDVEVRVRDLAERLAEGGNLTIKLGSAISTDFEALRIVRGLGHRVFADMKVFDTVSGLVGRAQFIKYYAPQFLTVSASVGISAMQALRNALPPSIKLVGVGIPTTMPESDSKRTYRRTRLDQQNIFFGMVTEAGLDGFVCNGREVELMRARSEDNFELFVAGVRPEWADVVDDDQQVSINVSEAIRRGATYIIVGRPITESRNPVEATKRIISAIGGLS